MASVAAGSEIALFDTFFHLRIKILNMKVGSANKNIPCYDLFNPFSPNIDMHILLTCFISYLQYMLGEFVTTSRRVFGDHFIHFHSLYV